MKIMFLNGPPGCGKDTAARILQDEAKVHWMTFAIQLKRFASSLFPMVSWFTQQEKDTPLDALGGRTKRQVLIHLSEGFFKPLWGPSYFGRVAVEGILAAKPELIVFSDSGFNDEVSEVIRSFPEADFSLVRISRPGKSFSEDSRSYIYYPQVRAELFVLQNDSTVEDFEQSVRENLIPWFKK